MGEKGQSHTQKILAYLISKGYNLSWFQLFINLLDPILSLVAIFRIRDLFEVLEYESTLELKDIRGKKVTFRKRERVRYLRDNIISYQDQAWGDGEILLNYKCKPGYPVDRYRPGKKTHILISLREVKNREDIDEFNIQWNIRNGFLRQTELWETTVSHPTKHLKINIIFPQKRPPLEVVLIEGATHKTQNLDERNQHQLPDGRWVVSWYTKQPHQNKEYVLKWKW
ncbi:hypothetical protein ACFLV7_11275 [Chloroflexota bacterium]